MKKKIVPLVILLLLAVSIYRLPHPITRGARLAAVYPVKWLLAKVDPKGVGNEPYEASALAPDSALEFARMEKKIADLEQKISILSRYTTDFGDDPGRLLAARIFLRGDTSSWRQTCYINAGSEHGVKNGMAVADAGGLLGTVCDVFPTYSRIALVTDPVSRIRAAVAPASGRTDGKGGEICPGIAEGTAGPSLKLRFIPDTAEIAPGDRVYTTGSDELLPPNILIGQVAAVRRGGNGLVYEVSVTPSGRLMSAVHVIVFLTTPPVRTGKRH